MLYVFYGNDYKKARGKAHKMREALLKKEPNAHYEHITDETVHISIGDMVASQGLFYPKQILFLDGVFANAEIKKDALDQVKEMKQSGHVFILLEQKLLAPEVKKFTTYAEIIEKYDLKAGGESKKPNNFALASAFAAKKKQDAWIQYHRALYSGAAPEALYGMLFWKVKDTVLKGGKASEYVGMLAELPYESRRKRVEIEYALELFLLST